MKAFLLAAGLGTRLKPLTNNKPKALVEIKGITLLELAINKLKKYGITEIVINVFHFAEQVIEFLAAKNNFGMSIQISDERGLLLDTGGGLKKASQYLGNTQPVLIYNVDIISSINLHSLLEHHKKEGSIATLAVSKRNSSRVLLFNEDNFLCGWKDINKNEVRHSGYQTGNLQEYAFSGIQIVDPFVFKHFPQKDVFSLVDLYLGIADEFDITYYDHTSDFWLDLGKSKNIEEASKLSSDYLRSI